MEKNIDVAKKVRWRRLRSTWNEKHQELEVDKQLNDQLEPVARHLHTMEPL